LVRSSLGLSSVRTARAEGGRKVRSWVVGRARPRRLRGMRMMYLLISGVRGAGVGRNVRDRV
jgi:hypothetical protein